MQSMDTSMTTVFQSTPPARGATISSPLNLLKRRFQSTPPARGATVLNSSYSPSYSFQSTPPARGATRQKYRDLLDQHRFQSTPPARGATLDLGGLGQAEDISIHAPREGGDSKDAQFYLRIFDKQVELLRFLGKVRGWLPEKPGERPAFSREKPCEPPGNLWSLGLRGGGKARPGYPCAVPLPRRAACVRGSGDPPADRCSSYRNAPLFSHIASPGSKSADCLSQNP